MKNSLKLRMVFVLMTLLTFMLVVSTLINIFFLEKYYEKYKISMLDDSFAAVENALKNSNPEDVTLSLDQLSSKQGVTMYLFKTYEYSLGTFLEVTYPAGMSERQRKNLEGEIYYFRIVNAGIVKNSKLIHKRDSYSIYKHFDSRLETNYIELYGTLTDDRTIFIRTNYNNIKESVGIANRFFMYAGLVAIAIGSLIMYLIGVNFTKPIKRLSEVTKEISELNFDVRYEEEREDEIGVLAHSINVLSEKLETAILGLKSANNALQSDIRQKEREDELRKEFLSNITHELKTPIALIQGYAEGLKININEAPEDKDFYCDVIIDEAAKMNVMVKQLLSLNQIELGMNKPEFERFDIISLIKSVVTSMEMLFVNKGIDCSFDYQTPIYVWADEFLIEEVLTNYITNAMNHVRENNVGKKLITVFPEVFEDRVRISVFNSGEPIPEEDVEHIWDKFYKVDKARTREYGGSGIGLSIVKAIMESQNNGYGLKNWDNGVEFWFELDIKA